MSSPPLHLAALATIIAANARSAGIISRSFVQRERPVMACAVKKAALSSGCKAHPAKRSSRKQPEQSWR